MEFKKLEIKQEGSWLKRTLNSQHTRRTLIYMAIGGLAGFLFFYFTEGKEMDAMSFGQIIKSILIGGFFGFFITNSPCARNKC